MIMITIIMIIVLFVLVVVLLTISKVLKFYLFCVVNRNLLTVL